MELWKEGQKTTQQKQDQRDSAEEVQEERVLSHESTYIGWFYGICMCMSAQLFIEQSQEWMKSTFLFYILNGF